MPKRLRDNDNVTVARGDEIIHASVYMGGREWFEFGPFFGGDPGKNSGIIDPREENIRWIRGWHWRWIPWSRKRLDALVTSAALAGPEPTRPAPAQPTPVQQMNNVTNSVNALMKDAQKLMDDMARSMGRLPGVTVTKIVSRWTRHS